MKKLSSALLALFLFAGCATTAPATSTVEPTTTPEVVATTEPTSTEEKPTIIAPYGAPALSLLPAFLNGYDITTVDGADALQAAFVNPTHQYDVIVAPTNLGMKLNQAGNSTYKLLDVVTWGNLYIIGDSEDALEKEGKFAGFGEQSVTGLVFNSVYGDGITPEITWYNSVTDAQAALLSGEANCAMIAEPAATATIAKAKENGMELSIIADLQASFNDGEGYPQAGLFVDEEDYLANTEKYSNLLQLMSTYEKEMDPTVSQEAIAADIDTVGTDVLGVPSSAIVSKVWSRMGIKIRDAASAETEINQFLSLFGVDNPDGIIK